LAAVETHCGSNFTVPIALPPIKYLSSYHIVTWSISRLCSFSRSFPSRFQICHPTVICSVAVILGLILCEIGGFSIVTQLILVASHICKWEVTERNKLHNLFVDHVTIQSEMKYLLGAKHLGLQMTDFEEEPGSDATVWVFHVVKLLLTLINVV
jgi:hypothetical protein